MNAKKISAAVIALSAMLSAFGCEQQKTNENPEPVSISTGITPQSVLFDWQTLYEGKLSDFMKTPDYSDKSMFDLHDLNADGVPELIISPNDETKTACKIFTYTDGMEQIEDIGSAGTFDILPSLSVFGHEYTGDGFTFGQYGTLDGNTFATQLTYYNNAASAVSGAVIRYEINSEEVSLIEYDNALKPYTSVPSVKLGRKYSFGKESIDYAIHCSESWGAVLSDIQKDAYKQLLTDILKKSPENDAAFELCDLDSNGLPELVLSMGLTEDSGCKVYCLNEAAAVDFGDTYGRNGIIEFDPKNNVFFSENGEETKCWSLTDADLKNYKKSESFMNCGRKYLLTADGINAAFL